MVGAVRGIDPETGHYFDDTKRYIDAAPNLSEADRRKIFEGNARRVYPRLAAKARELSGEHPALRSDVCVQPRSTETYSAQPLHKCGCFRTPLEHRDERDRNSLYEAKWDFSQRLRRSFSRIETPFSRQPVAGSSRE